MASSFQFVFVFFGSHMMWRPFAICKVRCLERSLALLKIGSLAFLWLCFKSSLCILGNSPLSGVSSANVFSPQSVAVSSLSCHCFSQRSFKSE